ncbi:MAG: type II toxin-antitoxin system RelE/ParE family toxin [Pirellulales bacterium]
MTFRVNLTDAAKDDIRAILRWIAERSPDGAEAWYGRWLAVLESLKEGGASFGLAPESEDHSESIRQVVFRTKRGRRYRALFSVRDDQVFVLHVRGPGQRLLRPDEME